MPSRRDSRSASYGPTRIALPWQHRLQALQTYENGLSRRRLKSTRAIGSPYGTGAPPRCELLEPAQSYLPLALPSPFASPLPSPFASPLPSPFAAPLPSPFAAPLPSPFAAPLPSPFAAPLPSPFAAPLPSPFAAPLPSPFASPLPSPFASLLPSPFAWAIELAGRTPRAAPKAATAAASLRVSRRLSPGCSGVVSLLSGIRAPSSG